MKNPGGKKSESGNGRSGYGLLYRYDGGGIFE